MSTAAIEARLTKLWETPKTVRGWFATVDHKELGRRYLFTALLFLIIGGVEALIMRLQLARADQTLLSPEVYDQIFTMHGVTMIFWYASPILSGFAIYLIPLMIGARDMALSAPQCIYLLVVSAVRNSSLCRPVYGPGSTRRMVRLSALHGD